MFQKIIDQLGSSLYSLFTYKKFEEEYLVVVLEKADYKTLLAAQNSLVNNNLIIIAKEDFEEGQDVFPLEFLDMQSSHKLIFGKNILEKIDLKKEDVRNQLERELRSKRIHLKSEFILDGSKNFLPKILPTLTPIIKGLLFMENLPILTKMDENLSKIASAYKIETTFLKEIENLTLGSEKIDEKNYLDLIEKLDNFLSQLIKKIN